ncbi:hypothetical protein P4H61_19785 [Paenibacillus peoriae]|uniref:hypothetical protein n=1 Tax=Paenibacillus peoriae TaxID=59893 RepID=UPI0009B5FD01|nr:hypothetical protein [Paenibacillus peoriae]MEC0183733.1 hypothetical protein [Paenibacillus peoriae]
MLKNILHRLLHSTSHSHKRRYSSSDRYYDRRRHSSSDGYKNSHNGHRYYKDKRRHYSSS